jgi:hypothetical protein
VVPVGGLAFDADEAAEFTSHFVVTTVGENSLGNRQAACQVLVIGIGSQRCL